MPRKDIPDFDFLLAPRIYLFILSGEIVSAPFSGMQVPSVWSLSIMLRMFWLSVAAGVAAYYICKWLDILASLWSK